ncbi:related to trans-aconitate 3-methyltransferase [Rhynchosporium agropyri]|uniref:Related to trans-aconitate 3-methyltransferase n=1 Tax=Rhynchosporium agropyri TaxID=914238 RepID=A0A1E1KCE4_9HELO|nr:related to trans-aconitate 3-methyltransferase [Rhynchosporium agropyri]
MTTPKPFASSEKTFTSYTKEQGKTYAQARPTYNPKLYELVLEHHNTTGGLFDTLLDVGCGPGITSRALAPLFAHVIGLDPSEGMIAEARSLSGKTATGESIRYEISTAEDLGWHLDQPVEDGSVDLITASTAAPWFDMAAFWPRAARVLKPGGTVAIWGSGQIGIHHSVPNSEALNAVLMDFEEEDLLPFFEPGNWLTRNLYVGLPLPWTLTTPVVEFDEESFLRMEWGTGERDSEEFFTGGALTMNLDIMEKIIGTASPVQRWREANPETNGTEKDVVRRVRREIERLMGEVGVEKGKEIIKGSPKGVLLIVKKKKA